MNFAPSDEQRELRDLARRILEDRATPDRLRELEGSGADLDDDLWRELARANLLGVAAGTEHGGMDLGFLALCLLIEECGRAVAPVPALPTLVMGALPISRFGSEAQRAQWIPAVVSGEVILTAGLAEADGEDPLAPSTRATRDGDDWRLAGVKVCVPHGARAARALVPAVGDEGPGLFLLDPAAEGVRSEPLRATAPEPQSLLRLDGVRVAAADVLVAPGRDAEALAWVVERAETAYAAFQLGVCDRALRMTAEYTSSREQFGRKLSTFQAVAQRAADSYVDVECLRLTVLQAAWLLAEERPAREEVAIAKFWAGDAGHRVSFAAQHLHGGIGVDVDYPLHRYCLWAKQVELTLGSSVEQLDRLGVWLAA